MDNEKKLEKVRKSSTGARIASKILAIGAVVAFVLCLLTAIGMFVFHEQIDSVVSTEEGGYLSYSVGAVNFKATEIDSIKEILPTETSLPVFQNKIDNGEYAVILGFYLLGISMILVAVAVIFFLFEAAFKTIIKEGTPFGSKAIKRITIALVILSIAIGVMTGVGFGVIMGLITWCIYTILDYGRALQVEADETL